MTEVSLEIKGQKFVSDCKEQIKKNLLEIEEIVNKLRKDDVTVNIRYPIGVNEGISSTRFEIYLKVVL